MSAFDIVMDRHSYRGAFLSGAVPREDLRRIMEAGLAAPSGCNKQTVSLAAVDAAALVERIKAVIDPPVAQSAPAFIVVLTRRIIAYRDKCYSVQDYSAAIENMLLVMQEMGYRSCWYEGYITDEDRICDKIAAILKVPEGYEVVCLLPVGKPADEPVKVKKEPFYRRAWFNTNASSGRIILESDRLYLREVTDEDFDSWYAVFSDRENMQYYPYVFDDERVRAWIKRNKDRYAQDGFGLWAMCLKETGEMIGDCGLTLQPIHGEMLPEIGYHIRRDRQRKGYAREAAAAVRDWAFTYTEYPAVYSYCKYTNVPSYRTAESIGMRFLEEYADEANEYTHVSVITREEWEQLKTGEKDRA